jgi:hypothetical protein
VHFFADAHYIRQQILFLVWRFWKLRCALDSRKYSTYVKDFMLVGCENPKRWLIYDTVSNQSILHLWWIWKDLGGSRCGLYQDTIPKFSWGDWGKPPKNSIRMVNALAEIRTKQLLNASLERYPYTNPVVFNFFCLHTPRYNLYRCAPKVVGV